MNFKRFIASVISVFITFMALDFIIHNIILMNVYASLKNLWRPGMESLMWMMPLITFILSILVTLLFIRGYQDRGIMEGVSFGILVGLMTNGLGAFSQYWMYPVPLSLAVKWFIFGLIEFIITGIVLSLVYRNNEKVDIE
ncbi:MAG TPA: hypothetical protein PK514_14170 [Spirochaetota bacterium]|nr:hypothetical protein [Spirochaetota bacterium]